MVNAPDVARILGGRRTLKRLVRNLEDLRRVVEEGLSEEALDRTVTHVAGEGPEATALKNSIVPRTTLARRGGRLSAEESERLERLARMASLAEQVWEDATLAREFLVSAQPQLGGERPIDLARSDLGARMVEDILFRLEYSLPV